MAEKRHDYAVRVRWTGNTGGGTARYAGYERAHEIEAPGKPAIPGSSDPSFRGDPTRWNPEELLLASLSACHKLWFLGLCAGRGLVVTAYEDAAEASMIEQADGAGQFESATLRPSVTLAPGSDMSAALRLHEDAHRMCFIARSVNFAVHVAPTVRVDD